MFRATLLTGFLLALTLGTPSLANAQDQAGLERYLAAVAKAERSIEEACATLKNSSVPDGRVWLRRGAKGLEIVPQDSRSAEAAAFWAQTTLGAEAAAQVLYGRAIAPTIDTDPVMIETASGVAVVHDGSRRSEGDACQALQSLIGAASPTAVLGNPFDAARDAARDQTHVALAIGGIVEASLQDDTPENAIARGPDGLIAEIDTNEDGSIIRITADGDASPGETTVRIYDLADPFTPLETIDVAVLPGTPVPTTGSEAAFSGDRHEGTLAMGQSSKLTLTIKEPQRVAFSSEQGGDLRAVLMSEDGSIIESDDDSGDGYGFSLSADLPPGRYVLNVSHCCGGGGRFVVRRGQ